MWAHKQQNNILRQTPQLILLQHHRPTKNSLNIDTWGLYYKTFYSHNFCHIVISWSVCHYYPSLTFAGEAKCMPLEWSLIRGSTVIVCQSFACKYQTRVEVTDRGNHSSLSKYCSIYHCKKIYSTGTCGQCYESFYGRKFRIFKIRQSVCCGQAFPGQYSVRQAPTHVKHLSGAPLKGRLPALPENNRLGWESLP